MGVLSVDVWLWPHGPASPAVTSALVVPAMPVTTPAVTGRTLVTARLTVIEAQRSTR